VIAETYKIPPVVIRLRKRIILDLRRDFLDCPFAKGEKFIGEMDWDFCRSEGQQQKTLFQKPQQLFTFFFLNQVRL
jgi:hypothetical protein